MALLQPPSFMQNRTDHTAQEDRLFLAGLVKPGGGIGTLSRIAGVNLVRAQASPNMSVIVHRERFFIPGTEDTDQGVYHGFNDADLTVTIAAASPTLPRIDIICASIQDSFYSGGSNQFNLGAITGTPASSPVPPTAPANSITIANIAVAANATSVTNANITNNATVATSTPIGLVAQNFTNSARDVVGGTLTNCQQITSVPVVAGRAYLIQAVCGGSQITNSTTGIFFSITTSDGALSSYRYAEQTGTTPAASGYYASGTLLWLPSSTGSYNVNQNVSNKHFGIPYPDQHAATIRY